MQWTQTKNCMETQNTEEVKLAALRTALKERSEKSNPSLRSNNT